MTIVDDAVKVMDQFIAAAEKKTEKHGDWRPEPIILKDENDPRETQEYTRALAIPLSAFRELPYPQIAVNLVDYAVKKTGIECKFEHDADQMQDTLSIPATFDMAGYVPDGASNTGEDGKEISLDSLREIRTLLNTKIREELTDPSQWLKQKTDKGTCYYSQISLLGMEPYLTLEGEDENKGNPANEKENKQSGHSLNASAALTWFMHRLIRQCNETQPGSAFTSDEQGKPMEVSFEHVLNDRAFYNFVGPNAGRFLQEQLGVDINRIRDDSELAR